MKSYLSLCIWGDGPGRPYDNVYFLKDRIISEGFIHLNFSNEEECIIIDPSNISISERGIKIDKAKRIVWKFYCYGRPKNTNTLTTVQYNMIDDLYVRVSERGFYNSEKVISIVGKMAFDSFGEINILTE